MTITGYCMLHYGLDYAGYAWRAIEPFIDQMAIVYTDKPRWNSTELECPDRKDALYILALSIFQNKLIWIEGEPQNYNTVLKYSNADLIIETDSDEIWQTPALLTVLQRYRSGSLHPGRYRVPMVHFWRSFNHVCRDASWPVRLCVGGVTDEQTMNFDAASTAPMFHFGYARSLTDMRYKIDTSMHKGEWRRGWWEQVFMAYPGRLRDLHPVSVNLWNAEAFDKRMLPAALIDHPYYSRGVIE